MLKEISVLCLSFLHGAVVGWFTGYVLVYGGWGFWIRSVYLDAPKHFFIALMMLAAGLVAFFPVLEPLPERINESYAISFGIAFIFFFFARTIKISRVIDKYRKNWPHSVGQLETISYGNKRTNLLGLAFVIVLLVVLVAG